MIDNFDRLKKLAGGGYTCNCDSVTHMVCVGCMANNALRDLSIKASEKLAEIKECHPDVIIPM